MPPSSAVHGGQFDTKYVPFEYMLLPAYVGERISTFNPNRLIRTILFGTRGHEPVKPSGTRLTVNARLD